MKLNEQRLIYKIESKDLKKAKWNFEVNLETAMDEKLIISVSESQLIRWIDKLKGRGDVNAQIKSVKSKIKKIKKNKEDTHRKEKLRKAYSKRDNLQFIPDLVNVVFPPCKNGGNRDYDRANKGFTINGVRFVRLLGTPNGIKKCTILYVAEDLHADLMKRIENDRKPDKELIPAKLEAYRALTCSGSLPIPAPDGVIVVKDCLTKFKENVIVIRDSEKLPEPELTYENDYEIEHNNSDGFGLMLPSYAAKVNNYLTNGNDTTPLSGAVIRYSFTKGLLVTFDFVEFAEKIAGTYEIIDVWGTPRDIRNAEIILTESQLKLWDSFDSWEHFAECSKNNGYEWAVTKICEKQLEDVRTSNYQFLNCYDFTDEEIAELCAATLNEIKKIMQLDPRATMLYLTGENKPNKENWENVDDSILSALMFAPEVINDPFVRAHIWHNITMKIERAKRGKLNFNANYAMVCGDPFALCQSMFGLEITGLLKAGEVYHKYWIDKGTKEIACFRAPMTNLANVRKLRLTTAESAVYWYQYIKTACILNAWDSTLEAENGADADGDTFFTTNNKIILRNTENLPTIISIQNKAEKTIPTEADVIAANKLAFSDEIGTITNIVTEMIDLRAKYPRDSEEYKILSYRIICGQHLQQAQIDKAKGAAVKEMPQHWKKKKSDDPYNELAATKKPYFMIYVYPELKTKYRELQKYLRVNAPKKCECLDFELAQSDHPDAPKLLKQFETKSPVTDNGCVVNRIAHYIEKEMADFKEKAPRGADYDYSILKSNVEYSTTVYNKIKGHLEEYIAETSSFMGKSNSKKIDVDSALEQKRQFIDKFKKKCGKDCPDDEQLTDILVDLIYKDKKSKCGMAWELCGNQITENLRRKANGIATIPVRTNDDNFDLKYNGHYYRMNEVQKNEQNERQVICA